MGMERASEILHEPLKEVLDVAVHLKVSRLNGETEDTFRTRVARAMQKSLFLAEGKPYPEYMSDRDKNYEEMAKNESYFNSGDASGEKSDSVERAN